ncbi:Spindle assembly checkpoint component Mad1 [Naviculisporaceae sp. PSN 640]
MSRTPSKFDPRSSSNQSPAMSFTPQGDPPGDTRRGSLSGTSNFRSSTGTGFSRPRISSRIPNFRATTTQPSYNLFTGETAGGSNPSPNMARPSSRQSGAASGPSPPRGRGTTVATNFSRESSKENMAPPDAEEYETQRKRIEELKAEVGTLRYQINSFEQEKEMMRLQSENEMRDTKRRAEDDFKAKQAADAEKSKAMRQVESLEAELEALREEKEQQKRALEGKAREAQEESRLLQEQLEDLHAAKEEADRRAEREIIELKGKIVTLERSTQEADQESHIREEILEKTQALLVERDETIGNLEAEVIRLKAQTGDAETIAVIRRELTDQVNHIRMLEAKNREQIVELKHLRQIHRAVEVVEEEKRSLQRKLEAAEHVYTELDEERTQRQRLEDERRAWTAYLESASEGGPVEFDSPEDVARALISERLHSASLLDQLGTLQPEIVDRDNIIRSLEQERATLKREIESLKTSGGGSSGAQDKARARLDRQRALAIKEVEYLRAQLKTFDMEDMTMQPEHFDEQKAKRIQELEDLVDQYKAEINTLNADLASLESSGTTTNSGSLPALGTKRPREGGDENEVDSEQLGQLSRKNRKLQSELNELQTAHRILEKEHQVTSEQLAAAKEQLKTRVLALRSNPTSDFEAVKSATLAALKLENAELLAHIERKPTLFATVPASQLAAAKREVEEARAETASSQKAARRLKEVWAAKSAEFKEAVFSTLGWTVTFIPGGKMRVESVYLPSQTDEHENSIVFDGEKGTMKVGGGPRSAFATRIGDNIKFWVRERGCVPCFLAALTLEFYEEHTRAVKPA